MAAEMLEKCFYGKLFTISQRVEVFDSNLKNEGHCKTEDGKCKHV